MKTSIIYRSIVIIAALFFFSGIKAQTKSETDQSQQEKKQAEFDKKQSVEQRQQAKLKQEQASLQKKQAERDVQRAQQNKLQAEKIARQKMSKAQEESTLQEKKAEVEVREKAELDIEMSRKEGVDERKEAIAASQEAVAAAKEARHAEEERQLLKNLLRELVKQNVVTDEKSIRSVLLTEDELIVNGSKQSAALHAKFKADYLKNSGGKIKYNSSTKTNDEDSKQ